LRALVSVLLVLTAQVIISCGSRTETGTVAENLFIGENDPVQESWNIHLTVYDSADTRLTLKAGHLAVYADDNDVTTRHLDEGVYVESYTTQGEVETSITANKGIIHPNGDLEAFDDVVIKSLEGTTIRTDYIKRIAASRHLWSDRFIVIEKPTETIRGYGFESNENLTDYTIFKASGESRQNP